MVFMCTEHMGVLDKHIHALRMWIYTTIQLTNYDNMTVRAITAVLSSILTKAGRMSTTMLYIVNNGKTVYYNAT